MVLIDSIRDMIKGWKENGPCVFELVAKLLRVCSVGMNVL